MFSPEKLILLKKLENGIANNKIITNCGYGRKISNKTQLISKFTSAQSTLCLNDTSVVKFKKNNLINKAYGATISNSFKIFDINIEENKTDTSIAATHNAYLDKYGNTPSERCRLSTDAAELILMLILLKMHD